MSKVMVLGAGGFIGRMITAHLRAQGHEVIEGRSAEFDYTRMLTPPDWLPHLSGLDAVVNAVGVLRDSSRRPMKAVHQHAPIALFEACAQAGVRFVVQVSALGIAGSETLYARSKRAADEQLLAMHAQGRLDAAVLRPSIVFGRGGASSQLFMTLARLPLLVMPDAALRAQVQPVAVQDLAEAVARRLTCAAPAVLSVVGPHALTLTQFIATLREQLGHRPARVLALPDLPSRWSARLGDHVPGQPWCTETLQLLQQDNADDPATLAALLGRDCVAAENLVKAAWAR